MRSIRLFVTLLAFMFLIPMTANAWVRGIYLTQYTAQVRKTMRYYIQQAKKVNIDTFVIDYNHKSRKYRANIALIKKNHIHYVARIVMFPYGALPRQVKSQKYLEKRYRQIMQAVAMGADEIQLDYIRYRKSQRPSSQNARNIYKIIQHVKNMLKGTGVKLQIDIFGVAAHSESFSIGQNVRLFANSVDAICPMVYPSHYEPFRYHAQRPYKTIYDSLTALKKQLVNHPHVKIYAYIELYNYRYPLSRQKKINYILAEIRAVRDAHADGWYAWSAKNKYSLLFAILSGKNNRRADYSEPANSTSQHVQLPTLPMPQ